MPFTDILDGLNVTSARIYRFHDTVALSFHGNERNTLQGAGTQQLYIEARDARKLARELIRYADACENKVARWKKDPATRIVKGGQCRNESDGKVRPIYLP